MIFAAGTLRDRIAALLGVTATVEPTAPTADPPAYRVFLDGAVPDEGRETMDAPERPEYTATIRVVCLAQAAGNHAAALDELIGTAMVAIAAEMQDLGGTGAQLSAPTVEYQRSGELQEPIGAAVLIYRAWFGVDLTAPDEVIPV